MQQLLSLVPYLGGTAAFALLLVYHLVRVRRLRAERDEIEHHYRGRIADHYDALKTWEAEVEHEVQHQIDRFLDERRQYENALIEARERAEATAQLKSTMLMNLSHEIRAPVSAIVGFAQILAEDADGGERKFARYIRENGQRLLNTLNAMLDLARLDSGSVALELEPLELAHVANNMASLFRPMAERKGLRLRVHHGIEGAEALVNQSALERVLQNLINNAVKFTERGEVVVETAIEAGCPTLVVRDTGIGMQASFVPVAFDEFQQEGRRPGETDEGCGLGLAITRRLVESMHGTIKVESARDEGTTFTVSFPPFGSGDGYRHETLPEQAQQANV